MIGLRTNSSELQPTYTSFLVLWLLSYNPKSWDYFADPKFNAIPLLT